MPAYNDLLNRRFEKSGFGGYKPADVDAFMTELATVFSKTDHEIADLKRRLDAAEKKLQGYEMEEESLKTTLLNAQRLADKMVNEAQSKADDLVKKAQESAELTIRDAQIKAEKILNNADREIELRKSEAERIKNEVSEFKLNLMRLYRSHIELINNIPAQDEAEFLGEDEAEIESAAEDEQTVCETQQTLDDSADVPAVQADAPDPEIVEQQQEKIKVDNNPVVDNNQEGTLPEADDEHIESASESGSTLKDAEKEAAPVAVKLNLKYNAKTGEYEPIGKDYSPVADDEINFGADYDIYSVGYTEKSSRRKKRK